jgi:hypothetical protein
MADKFTYRSFFVYVQNEMLCTKFKHIIVFLLGNSFRIVLSAVILCFHRCLRHYNSSDTNQLTQEEMHLISLFLWSQRYLHV